MKLIKKMELIINQNSNYSKARVVLTKNQKMIYTVEALYPTINKTCKREFDSLQTAELFFSKQCTFFSNMY